MRTISQLGEHGDHLLTIPVQVRKDFSDPSPLLSLKGSVTTDPAGVKKKTGNGEETHLPPLISVSGECSRPRQAEDKDLGFIYVRSFTSGGKQDIITLN